MYNEIPALRFGRFLPPRAKYSTGKLTAEMLRESSSGRALSAQADGCRPRGSRSTFPPFPGAFDAVDL
jgi:hypothetical protein